MDDVLIIGGGINGAAIARDAALRGFKTTLVEQHDFACGASSKSSKLIHGGLRYLEQMRFRLVRESLAERSLLLEKAPAHVTRLPFFFPFYKGGARPAWMVRLGLTLYDLLSPQGWPKHSISSKEAILQHFPGIRQDGLTGGCSFWDAEMLDNRLVFANLRAAEQAGTTLLNYTKVIGLIKEAGRIVGAALRDMRSGKEWVIQAKSVVNATGAWSNAILEMDRSPSPILTAPTKGVHLVLPSLNSDHALILSAPQDGRIFFILPWNGQTLVGTTDTPFSSNPDDLKVDQIDIDYLLTAYRHYFPEQSVTEQDIIAAFAGLRPLVKDGAAHPSSRSRDYLVETSPSGLITLLGGKFTTYRMMAEKVVDTVCKKLGKEVPCTTQTVPLAPLPETPPLPSEHLIRNYGADASIVLELAQKNPKEAEQICPHQPHIWAEVTFAVQYEKARTVDDWLYRRTSIGYSGCRGMCCRDAVAEFMRNLA